MTTGAASAPVGPTRSALPAALALGVCYALVEFLWQAWVRPSPAGAPGDSGGSIVAHLFLGLSVFGLPALAMGALTRSLRSRVATWLVLVAAMSPTALLAFDRACDLYRWTWSGSLDGGIHHYLWLALVGVGSASIFAAILAPWVVRSEFPARFASGVLVLTLLAPVGLRVALTAPTVSDGPSVDSENAPNVLLVTVDTVRQDALGAYGGPATPHLDALIGDGVRFDGWAPSPWTRTSMASIFCGLTSSGHGADAEHAPAVDIPWWPELLQSAGYRSAAFVTNPHLRRRFGFDRGFSEFDHAEEVEALEPIARTLWAEWVARQIVGRGETSRGDVVVRAAMGWLGEASEDTPWLLWVHLLDPHLPYNLRGADGALHDPTPGAWIEPLRSSMDGERFFDLPGAREGTSVATVEARVALRALYQREVAFADHWVGELITAARSAAGDRGLVWAFASDHGEEFWDAGSFEHGHTLDPSVLRVPLAMGGHEALTPDPDGGPLRLQDIGPLLLAVLDRAPMDISSSSGLEPDDVALIPFAEGSARRAPGDCAPSLLAEGMLYGPPRTLLLRSDGSGVQRWDEEGRVEEYRICAPAESGTGPPLEELLLRIDSWRQRNEDRARPVALDPALRERLRAVGYLQ